MDGRVVLYTGAAGGLGLETTLSLLGRGATVLAVDNDARKVAALTAAVQAAERDRLHVAAVDMGDLEAFRAELKRRVAGLGTVDVVINNAAIYPSKPFEDYTIEEHQQVQRVNVDAAIVAVQETLPGMKAQGRGRIVNVSSITLSGGWSNLSPYVASKGALVGLTRAWAREFGPYGVTVNAIAPGAFPTDAEKIHPDPEGYNRQVLERQSIKRRGRVADITNAILFFAADESGFVTGQTLNVDGGWIMQ